MEDRRQRRRLLRAAGEGRQLARQPPGGARLLADLRRHHAEAQVVVVDRVAEQAVVGAGQLAEADGDRPGRKLRVDAPTGVAVGGGGELELVEVVFDVEAQQSPDDGDRAPDQPRDRARCRASRAGRPSTASCRSRAAAPTARSPVRARGRGRCGPRRRPRPGRRRTARRGGRRGPDPGRAVRRSAPGGRARPPRPPRRSSGSCISWPSGMPEASKHSSASSTWSGSSQPATGLTAQLGVLLVDPRLDRARRRRDRGRRGGTRAGSAAAAAAAGPDRARRPRWRLVAATSILESTPSGTSTQRPKASTTRRRLRVAAPPASSSGRSSAAGWLVGVARGIDPHPRRLERVEAEQRLAETAEASREQVEAVGGVRGVGELLLADLGELALTGVVASLLVAEPVADLRRERPRRGGRDQGAGGERPLARGVGLGAVGDPEVDSAERPAIEPVVDPQRELPVAPQRHPGLRPRASSRPATCPRRRSPRRAERCRGRDSESAGWSGRTA